VSWPKIPSVAPDGYHERESEGRRLFLMKKAAGGLMQTARFRQFDASFGVNFSMFSTPNQPGRRGA
jgi:hypothetical protein